jgi:hypothetical protein
MRSRALHRWTLVVGVLAIVSPAAVAVAAPVAATARPHAIHSAAARHASASQRMLSAMAAAPSAEAAGRVWLAAERTAALAHFAPTATDAAAISAEADPFALLELPLISAGDLTGNGGHDVLDTRLDFRRASLEIGVTARDARNGHVLWSRKAGSAKHFVLPLSLSALDGPSARGLLVADFMVSGSGQSERTSIAVEAWSGKTGKTVWKSTPVVGTMTTSGKVTTITNMPGFPTPFDAVPGRPIDALIPTISAAFTGPEPDSLPASANAVLVSGATGATTTPYQSVSSTTGTPQLQPVADLSGDRLADVLAIVPGKPGAITALRGNSGATIWSDSRNVGRFFDDAVTAGRISGGRISDLLLGANGLTLVRGRDGKVLWTRHGSDDEAVPLEAVRPGHAAAIGLVSEFGEGSASSDGTGSERTVVDIRAVTATNRVAWHTQVTASVNTTARHHADRELSGAAAAGDVQPDGTVDFVVRATISNGHKRVHKAGIVSGRTGAFRPGVFGSPSDGSLVRGHATDLLRASVSGKKILLSGYDGKTGALIMSGRLAAPSPVHRAVPLGVRATGHHCSDVEVAATLPGRRRLVDMVSGSGAPLWSLRFSAHRVVGGHLLHYKAPQHFCAA